MIALLNIPDHLVNPVISAIAIILGSLIGALFSWIITRKNTLKNIEEQYRIMRENIKHEELYKDKEICQNANIIRLDICTVLFQSIRTLKQHEIGEIIDRYPIPINKSYSCTVSSLSDKYSLKELSYIYQLYGIIEKLNYDILNCNFYDDNCFKTVINGYADVLKKIYGDSYKKILTFDIDVLSYEQLYDNEYVKSGYREVLKKLDTICAIENLKEN